MVLVGLPALVLMPLFWLESQLRWEALAFISAPATVLLLIALALVVLVNVVGALVVVALGVRRRWPAAAVRDGSDPLRDAPAASLFLHPVREFITRSPVTAGPRTPVRELARQMAAAGVGSIVIVGEDGLRRGS